ncbi:hypothetical protein ACIRON_02720 [Nocardioides sp. NPDC101246]|uniref:hypothetical protein n=1 Tax=Nocardioides sp. NPDC101246 TaxID=3364336 RepID=UPI0038174F11
MIIHVEHSGVTDLAADLRTIAVEAGARMAPVVDKNVRLGERTAKRLAKASSGLHGKNYFKRITSESHGLEGEWGPHDGGVPVGGGWRHGENTDQDRSADLVAPKFARDVANEADKLFWPGA